MGGNEKKIVPFEIKRSDGRGEIIKQHHTKNGLISTMCTVVSV